MADLTASKPRQWGHGDFHEYDVAANTNIYQGMALVVNATGEVVAATGAATSVFVGFAEHDALNNPGAAGAVRVRVRARGLVRLPVTGVDKTKVGAIVLATDSDTFTLTSAANRPVVGKVRQHITGTECWVDYDMNSPAAA